MFPPYPGFPDMDRLPRLRVLHERLNAPEDLPKEAPGQVTLGEVEVEVPRMPNEAAASLEQSLLSLIRDQLWIATARTSRHRRLRWRHLYSPSTEPT
jgi:hypothetical protein